MSVDLKPLDIAPRLLIEARLKPVQGHRFQPTGFPNLGAAIYKSPGGIDMLLVESAQSIANRLEAVCWDPVKDDWVFPLRGLPIVKVFDEGKAGLTNSVAESHRLNSAYIANSTWFGDFKKEIGYDEKASRPIDMRGKVYPALLKFDPNCLLHGVFLEKIAGAIRTPRALSGFVEAEGIAVAASGGVKFDRVKATSKSEGGGSSEGYGNVPFSRDEFTASTIVAYFNIDLAQIRGFGLGKEADALLIAIALFKIRKFLVDGLRLRTACDLDLVDFTVTRPKEFRVPELGELEAELPTLISAVQGMKKFAEPAVTIVTWKPKSGTGKARGATKAPEEQSGDDET